MIILRMVHPGREFILIYIYIWRGRHSESPWTKTRKSTYCFKPGNTLIIFHLHCHSSCLDVITVSRQKVWKHLFLICGVRNHFGFSAQISLSAQMKSGLISCKVSLSLTLNLLTVQKSGVLTSEQDACATWIPLICFNKYIFIHNRCCTCITQRNSIITVILVFWQFSQKVLLQKFSEKQWTVKVYD